MKLTIVKKIAAAAFWIIIWQLFALIVAKPLLVPSPVAVVKRLSELCVTVEFWQTVGLSLLRITGGIALSIILGTAFGIISYRFEVAALLLEPVMSLVKATPVASFIMLALLWLDRNALPVFISVLIVVPVVTSNITAGIVSVDKELAEVAKIFRFSTVKKIKRLYVPFVYPYFMSACRASLGLAWKAGIAAEVLAVPAFSIGKMIYDSKLYLETTDLFAWTSVIVLLSILIEYVVCAVLKKLGARFERQVQNND